MPGYFDPPMHRVFGLQVYPTSTLPVVPTDGENARRIVRHGLADVLRWLGEKPGPAPGEEMHAMLAGRDLFISPKFYHTLMVARPGEDKEVLDTIWKVRNEALMERRL